MRLVEPTATRLACSTARGNLYVPVRTFEARVEGGEVRLEIGS
jgi:hypothetical protein